MDKDDHYLDSLTEEWKLHASRKVSRNDGVFHMQQFIDSISDGEPVDQRTLEYLNEAFKSILHKVGDSFILKTEDHETGEILARQFGLWAGKSLQKRRKEQSDLLLAIDAARKREEIDDSDSKVTDAQVIQALAVERGITTVVELERFDKSCRRAFRNAWDKD